LKNKDNISSEDIIEVTEMVRDLTEEEIKNLLLSNPLFKILLDEAD
jgi:hypothetical protein